MNLKKFELLNILEDKLQRFKYYRNSWITIIFFTLLLLGLTAITLGYLFGEKDPQTVKNFVANATAFATPAKILVYVSYGVILTPFIYLTGAWISGINHTSRSKYFHLFVWICYTIAALFIIISIILCFRAGMN